MVERTSPQTTRRRPGRTTKAEAAPSTAPRRPNELTCALVSRWLIIVAAPVRLDPLSPAIAVSSLAVSLVRGNPLAQFRPAGRMAWEPGAQRVRVCRVPGKYGVARRRRVRRVHCTQVTAKPECGGRSAAAQPGGRGGEWGAWGSEPTGGRDRGRAPPRAAKETGERGWRWLRRQSRGGERPA